jgi:hypothetical protein
MTQKLYDRTHQRCQRKAANPSEAAIRATSFATLTLNPNQQAHA